MNLDPVGFDVKVRRDILVVTCEMQKSSGLKDLLNLAFLSLQIRHRDKLVE